MASSLHFQAVSWKPILGTARIGSDEMKTLYVGADDGDIFVRWHVGEIGSSPARRMTEIIKAAGGHWDRSSGWQITDLKTLESVKAVASKSRPAWSVVSISREGYPIVLRQISTDGYVLEIDLAAVDGVITPLSKAGFFGAACRLTSWVHDPSDRRRLISRTLRRAEAETVREKMELAGAEPIYEVANDRDQVAWGAQPIRVIRSSVVNDVVDVRLDLNNPLHRRFIAPHLSSSAPIEPRVIIPGANWAGVEADFRALGGAIEFEVSTSRLQSDRVDFATIPGWEQPAANGFRLFEHQRTGVEFLLGRHLRAIVGDEMGLGKTGTAITAATAANAQKILVVVPANARWVWDREIRGWTGDSPMHLETSLTPDDLELPAAGWVIVTYDLLTARAQRHVVKTHEEAQAIKDGLTSAGYPVEQVTADWDEDAEAFRFESVAGNFLRDMRLPEAFADVQKKLNRMGRRLSSELLHTLLEWNPDAVFVDEGHRIKNAGAGRTKAVRLLLEDTSRGAALLSGTPLRNHAGEGASLIDAILPGAKAALAKFLAKGFWTDAQRSARNRAVGELLKTAMIRRLKADVLDLPPKIRQWCDITACGEPLSRYTKLIDEAVESLATAVKSGSSEQAAAKNMLPILAQARRFLGLAKTENPAVADLIDEIVEEKGAVLVFAIHRDVINALAAQLQKRGLKVGVVTGETAQRERAKIEKDFQVGALDVFLGSINAAGEALTLTRADTAVFVELDWVPSAMFQAEDRGHRAGQIAQGYHIITLPARMPDGDDCLDQYVEKVIRDKLVSINETLEEHATVDGETASDTSKILAMITSSMMTEDLRKIVARRQKDTEESDDCVPARRAL